MATTTAAPGLAVAATDPIRSFLSSAAASVDLAADLRDLAADLTSDPAVDVTSDPAVSYRSLRAIWCATSPDTRPPLRDLLQGADFVLPSPKPREKSAELKARLEKLREIQERKEYAELVKDVAPPSKDDAPEPFSSYKDQIGFGSYPSLHVVVIIVMDAVGIERREWREAAATDVLQYPRVLFTWEREAEDRRLGL